MKSLNVTPDNPLQTLSEIYSEISEIQLQLLNLQRKLLDTKFSLIQQAEFTPVLPLIEQKKSITF